jgi:hypothetical protein
MDLEDRINSTKYDIGHGIHSALKITGPILEGVIKSSKTVCKRIKKDRLQLLNPVNHLKFAYSFIAAASSIHIAVASGVLLDAYYIAKNAIGCVGDLTKGTACAAYNIKKNYRKGFCKGNKKTVKSLTKKMRNIFTKTLDYVVSLPGIATIAAGSYVLSGYLSNINRYFPFGMSLNSPFDYITLVPKATLNMGFATTSTLYDFGSKTLSGIPSLDLNKIGDGISSLTEIGNTHNRLIEKMSFSNNIDKAEYFLSASGLIITSLAAIVMGKYICKKTLNHFKKKKDKTKDSTKLIGELGKAGLFSGVVLASAGYLSSMYHAATNPIQTGYSMVSGALAIADHAFGSIHSAVLAIKSIFDYALGRGIPDTLGVIDCNNTRVATNILQNIYPCASSLTTAGISLGVAGSLLFLKHCHKYYKDHTPKYKL